MEAPRKQRHAQQLWQGARAGYGDEIAAAQAYDEAALRFFGKHAR